MKNIKSCFSLAFYRETLLRTRTFGIIVSIVFTALACIGSASYLFTQISAALSGIKITTLTPLTLADVNGQAGTLVTLIAPIMTVVAFSFLMKRNESDFYEAIPVTRGAMAVSGMLAVITTVTFALVVSSVFSVLVLIPCMGVSVKFFLGKSVVQFLGFLLAALLAVAAATVAVSVTGTQINAIVTAGVIMYVPRMIMSLINSSIEFLNPELVSGHIIPFFNGDLNILASLIGDSSAFNNPWSFLYTAILFIAYSFLAVLLFVKRKSESATHAFANKFARHATRIAIATLVATFGIFLMCLSMGLIFLSVFSFAVSVGVYFSYEVATGRKEKTFISSLVTFPIFVGVSVLLGVFVVIANLALGAYSPSADEIDSVSVVSDTGEVYYLDYSDYVTLCSENTRLEDADTKNIVASAFGREITSATAREYQQVVFKIKTKGGTAYRRLYVSNDEMWVIGTRLAEDEDYEKCWLSVGEGAVMTSINVNGVELDEEAAMRVLEAAKTEINALGFERWYEIYNNDEEFATMYYTVYRSGDAYNIILPISESLTETARVCEEERRLAAEAMMEKIKSRLDNALSGDGESVWLSISYYAKGNYIEIDEEIAPNSTASSALVGEFLPLVSSAPCDYDGLYLSICVYDDELFSENIYIDLAVADRVGEERLLEFLKKYGTEY